MSALKTRWFLAKTWRTISMSGNTREYIFSYFGSLENKTLDALHIEWIIYNILNIIEWIVSSQSYDTYVHFSSSQHYEV